MVKALAIVAALAGVAAAEDDDYQDPDDERVYTPYQRSLGLRILAGETPLADRTKQDFALGITFEQRLCGRLRALAEYEHLWIGERGEDDDEQGMLAGNGHRGYLGLRVTLRQSRPRFFENHATFYVDAEAGGGVMRGREPIAGAFHERFGFVGLRLGYGFHRLNRETRASHTYEAGVVVRALKSDEGTSVLAGVGIAWGD